MNQDFVLGKLSEIMDWDTERARNEFAWLRLMSRLKYDGYQDFLAGVRFIESLADWIQQFEKSERETAYRFIRKHLVYISLAEMQHLVELFYPETVQWRLLRATADRLRIPQYRVWSLSKGVNLYETLLRKSLFIGLSDGARMDLFRRSNVGSISNEQVIAAPRIIKTKWDALLRDLRTDLDDKTARFAFVFLVDDFVASGTTLLREREGSWTGKLVRFWDDLKDANVLETHLEDGWMLCVHHYMATHRAFESIEERNSRATESRGDGNWFARVQFSHGMVLPAALPVDRARHGDFMKLADKYYDDSVETEHTKLGGSDVRLGFGRCALPLVIEHNTPNNSLALLWAETEGKDGKHAMRPLFRRRQRHT